MNNTVRMIRLACCALAVIAITATAADARSKKKVAAKKPAVTATTTTTTSTRPDAAVFNALPKLAPVSAVSDAAQTGGTAAANQAQIKRQQAFDAAEKARQDKIAADQSAYEKQETEYRQTMEGWNKRVAACKAGDASQCGAAAPVAK
jgi:hypothetical protein